MAGPAEPFSKGRLVLVFAVSAVLIVGVWLALKPRPEEPVTAERPEPLPPEPPITTLLASADAARGERFFRARCGVCHTIEPGAPHGIGPNLHGAMGQPVAARPGYEPSDALSGKGGRWDWETTSAFLRSPRAFAPGTRMTFAGVSDPQDRADVLLYMNGQGGSLAPPAAGPTGTR